MYKNFLLDPKTVFVLYFCANLFICLLIFVCSFCYSESGGRKNLWNFGLGKMLLTLGWVLIFFRGIIADFITVNIANTLVLCSCYFEAVELLNLLSGKFNKAGRLLAVWTAFGVFIFNFAAFFGFDINQRTLIVTFILFFLYLIPVFVFFYEKKCSFFQACHFFCYALFTLLLAFKFFYSLFSPSNFFFSYSLFECIYNISLFLLTLIGTVGFLLLIKMKQDVEIRELLNDKNKFFSVIAHDLRGALGASVQLSDMVLNDLSSYDSAEIIESMLLTHEVNLNTYKLLENLLSWSKLQTGQFNYALTNMDLTDIVAEVLEQVKGAALTKSITISLESFSASHARIDKNMIESVIRNLLTNAIKFTAKKGAISVRVYKEAENAVIRIADNGIGMSPNIQRKIFKLNSRVVQKGTENEEGTGLGLLLCSEFVKKNNGDIWFESEVGAGSAFYVSFPLSY